MKLSQAKIMIKVFKQHTRLKKKNYFCIENTQIWQQLQTYFKIFLYFINFKMKYHTVGVHLELLTYLIQTQF